MCKVAFQLGNLTIYWYGIFVAAGILAGLWIASRYARLRGITAETIIDSGIWLVISGLIGARLFYVILNWKTNFANQPFYEVFMIQKGGLVYYGGLLGGILGGIIFSKIKKIPILRLLDVLAIGLPVGHFFGRIGCFMNGCCYGKETTLPWAVHFPSPHETFGKVVHPTELYEAILNLALFFYLVRYYKKGKPDGSVAACYLISYGLLRFAVEFLRGDYPPYQLLFGFLTPAQGLSVILIAIGIVLNLKLPGKVNGQDKK
ncbi:MAG TPA: prolipoprotein diacylglyceryl transferase [Verrucomicrobiota bacterium]|nr:prolipoprotein diacylglyceryl transferase [Verrucomicrobiota bacterium]